jgi:hypothetical protein
MVDNVAGDFRLDEISSHVQISEGKAKSLKEACIWVLWHCQHSNGVQLKVIQDEEVAFYTVSWRDDLVEVEPLKRSFNLDDAKEYGAEALALFLSVHRTEYDAVERSMTKTGIDYWLGFKNRNPNEPFHRAGRLEVSGMIETPSNKMSRRVKEKLEQTKPTDHTFPAYVIVVEFGQPYATIVQKR